MAYGRSQVPSGDGWADDAFIEESGRQTAWRKAPSGTICERSEHRGHNKLLASPEKFAREGRYYHA